MNDFHILDSDGHQIQPEDRRFQIALFASPPNAVAQNGRRTWWEKTLVPALLGGILVIAGWLTFHITAEIREIQAEVGTVRADLGEIKGRLDGVDKRIDDLRNDLNERLGRIEAALMSQRSSRDAGP